MHVFRKVIPLLCFFICSAFYAQDSLKSFTALRISSPPKIDGLLDDEAWKITEVLSGFIQNTPTEGAAISQKTEVRIVYDNYAIYVGAMLYDTAPDSILHELGTRDNDGLNAEKFRILFDPYLSMQDAYEFAVFSSGVQVDHRISDYTYNAVWQSAVKIHGKNQPAEQQGWSVEIKIPYSAIRFPSGKTQTWGLQVTRDIRRNREFDQWALTPSGKANPQKYWGILKGIADIEPPLRLSLTPYFSTYYERTPDYQADGSHTHSNSFSYNAGADIKYGLDERFTLDMTLLPDFGQVQSDNKVKNISYREINYEDFRPFFKEGTDLFNKDGLFYSRRVGKTPSLFYSVPGMLNPGEEIEKNPSQTKLINATKLTGRTNSGLGIGVFNAITDNTYAEIKDSLGNKRKILTEPLSNYNVFVFDQQLKNSSRAYFINTNVIREGKASRNANVSGAGFTLQNKKNTWALNGSTNLSQVLTPDDSLPATFNNNLGYFYAAGLRKTSGTWQYGLYHEIMNNTFDRSDMGYYATTNYAYFGGNASYNIFKARKHILRSYNNININYSHNYLTRLRTDFNMGLNLYVLYKNYLSVFGGGGFAPLASRDYYEPRVAGRYSYALQGYWINSGVSTDYRKQLALELSVNSSAFMKNNLYGLVCPLSFGLNVSPRFRVNDQLTFQYNFNFYFDPNNLGFASTDDSGDIIYGERVLHTYANTLSATYIFKNDLSLSLRGRQYWNTGEYIRYYTLLKDGMLAKDDLYSGNNDFSYNAFNIDAVFSWQFAPGSLISLVYKNAIEKDEQIIIPRFDDNFSHMMQSPQTNSISLKILYYLDYLYLKRNVK